jgi:hypothetical protein
MDTRKAGKLGGQARARNLTPEQRIAAARKASRARWAKRPRYVTPRKGTR